MTTSNKRMKSAPVSHIRCPVYQASKTGTEITTARITSERHGITWTVTGRLGQVHTAIRNVLLSGEYEQIEMSDGAVLVLCDVYGVLRRLGHKSPNAGNARWLRDRIEDLRVASLVEDGPDSVTMTGIVYRHQYSKITDSRGRQKYAVVFSAEYVRSVRQGMSVCFSPAQAQALARMPAVASAAMQYMWTHRPGAQYRIDTLLDAIGVSGSKSKMSKDRSKIKAAIESQGALFGIRINADTVTRTDVDVGVSTHTDTRRRKVSTHTDARSAHTDAVSAHTDAP